MTKSEAIKLEERCDKIMSGYLGKQCTVSLALSGNLKVSFEDGGYIAWKIGANRVHYISYISYVGSYDELEDDVNNISGCIDENLDIFEKLVWSYEHRGELEE